MQNYGVHKFGEGHAHCISTVQEINENLMKDTLRSKDVGEAQLLKITNWAVSFFHSITKIQTRM